MGFPIHILFAQTAQMLSLILKRYRIKALVVLHIYEEVIFSCLGEQEKQYLREVLDFKCTSTPQAEHTIKLSGLKCLLTPKLVCFAAQVWLQNLLCLFL